MWVGRGCLSCGFHNNNQPLDYLAGMSQKDLHTAEHMLKHRPKSSIARNLDYGSSGKYSSDLLNGSKGSHSLSNTEPFHLV